MQYYEIFNLSREPFSNSPDPDFFFESEGHRLVLHNLEIALRLRRGLNIVLGEVGTGKTTLCRRLLRELAEDSKVEAHLLLDPTVGGTRQFLAALRTMLCDETADGSGGDFDEQRLKEDIKDALFSKGVDQDQVVVLLIDEAQKITPQALEVLRELLNYETNDSKLLQIVLFAQNELQQALDDAPNLADRVNGLYRLGALSFSETRTLVRHRLRCAAQGRVPPDLFSWGGYRALHRATGGFPRRIIRLCHKVVLALIMQDRRKAGYRLVQACARDDRPQAPQAAKRATWAYVLATVALAVAAVAVLQPGWLPGPLTKQAVAVAVSKAQVPAVLPETPAPLGLAPASAPLPSAPQPQIVPVAPALPLMGEVTVGQGESLSIIVIGVYGGYRPSLLARLQQANPDLIDPLTLSVGERVAVPLQYDSLDRATRRAWLQLDSRPTLGEAWQVRRVMRHRGFDVRVLPWWNAAGQPGYAVGLGDLYATEAEARAALAVQAPPLRTLLSVASGLAFHPAR